MKKFLYLAIILLGVGFLSSCEKVGGGNSNSIIGKWKVVYSDSYYATVGEVWEFEKDGTFVVDGYPMYQYRYDASTGIVKYAASGEFKVLSITSTKMRISFDEDCEDCDFAELEKVK